MRLCHTVVRQGLDQARKWGFVAFNVATNATLPRCRKKDIKPPLIDVLRQLLDLAAAEEAEFALYLRVLAATGCRRGEGLALRWGDLDPLRGELTVGRSIAHVGERVVEKDTKDPPGEAHRHRPGHACRARDPPGGDGGAGGGTRCGATSERACVRQRRLRTAVASGCRYEPVHQAPEEDRRRRGPSSRPPALRRDEPRTADAPIATISGRLGHRDVATTLNVYSHFLPADDREAARTLGDLLGRD